MFYTCRPDLIPRIRCHADRQPAEISFAGSTVLAFANATCMCSWPWPVLLFLWGSQTRSIRWIGRTTNAKHLLKIKLKVFRTKIHNVKLTRGCRLMAYLVYQSLPRKYTFEKRCRSLRTKNDTGSLKNGQRSAQRGRPDDVFFLFRDLLFFLPFFCHIIRVGYEQRKEKSSS